ncbi:ankyrin [Wilcoxina mikolae CBS 423.85]|nr:ankyrin [Wilcoxina mikolae CBS 423.85]
MPSFNILIPYIMRSKSFSPRLSWYQKASSKPKPSTTTPTVSPAPPTTHPPLLPPPPAKTTLHHLPTELLLLIIPPLTTKDLSSLILSCKNLYHRLNGTLWLSTSPTTILHRAAQCGWDSTLLILLEKYSIPPSLPRENLAPLHWTCNHIHYRSTQLLLSHGASVEGVACNPSTPLHYAAMAGNAAAGIIKLLLTHGANIHATDRCGKTPLHIAAEGGYGGVVVVLLEYGADTERRDGGGHEPLFYAARHGFVKILVLLLKAGADPDAGGALAEALERRHEAVVEALVMGGADPERCGGQWVEDAQGLLAKYTSMRRGPPLLHMAVSTRDVGRVKTLCKDGMIDLEEKFEGRTALWLAASLGYGEVVDVLLDCGASWETRDDEGGKMPCEVAYGNGHKAVGYTLARWKEISWSALMAGK